MTNIEVNNALTAIKNIIDFDLIPFFDGFSTDFVPVSATVPVDWITYIKSPSFVASSFVTEALSFSYFLENALNYLAVKNDPYVSNIVFSNSDALALYFASPCVPLLQTRTVTLAAFNAEVMTGKVFIVSYRPYISIGEYPTFYWELRKASDNTPYKRVYRTNGNDVIFHPVNLLVDKSTLVSFYSYTASNFDPTAPQIKVIDV